MSTYSISILIDRNPKPLAGVGWVYDMIVEHITEYGVRFSKLTTSAIVPVEQDIIDAIEMMMGIEKSRINILWC